MKLLVGLGNPETRYLHTRHNAGFLFVDYYQSQQQTTPFLEQKKFFSSISKGDEIILAKPLTYMNKSGQAVSSLINFYHIDLNDLIVAHDDLDLALGSFKLQLGTGPKIHNGLNSIYQQLASKQFWHLRIGVDSRNGDRSIPGTDYVLQNFSPAEFKILDEVFSQAIKQIIQK
jgi:PTH1 family peptidyl-tRNA hydrolase